MKGQNFKAGIFVTLTLALLIVMILRVSQGGLFFSKTYPIYLEVTSAVGISKNTPVQIAGVDVGVVDSVTLAGNKARLKLNIRNDVVLPATTKANIKTTGILGDAYIDLYQAAPTTEVMPEKFVITDVTSYGDLNSLTGQMSLIADDVKAITSQMRKLMAGDDSSFDRTMKNIEKITASLSRLTTNNEQNIDVIIANLKALSQNLNTLVASNQGSVNRSIYNIEDITSTVARGEGTVGKLIKDDETANKINDTLDSIQSMLGGMNRMQVDVGMHSEYLAGTGDFKNYVSLYLKPRPDKYFLVEVNSDPDPSFETYIEETTVTSGTTTSTITTQKNSKKVDAFRFSAQIAKKYRDFTIRGGLIESTGGVGLDYDRGPVGLSFSAFDFRSNANQRPHLKGLARAQLTHSFYLLAGVDDFINTNQDVAWFLGAGLTFTDDDIKSLLGLVNISSIK